MVGAQHTCATKSAANLDSLSQSGFSKQEYAWRIRAAVPGNSMLNSSQKRSNELAPSLQAHQVGPDLGGRKAHDSLCQLCLKLCKHRRPQPSGA